jgi:uncharacterized glyoxalase superfamily protein PhnB
MATVHVGANADPHRPSFWLATFERAIEAGATIVENPVDTPYGDRRAMVSDPFGNVFQIAHQLPAR